MNLVTIKMLDQTNERALFFKYEDLPYPQPCYIYFDTRNGVMTAGYDAEREDVVPTSVWLGYVRRWKIQCMTPIKANDLMIDISRQARELLDELDKDKERRWSNKASRLDGEMNKICFETEGDIESINAFDYMEDHKEEGMEIYKNGSSIEELVCYFMELAWNGDEYHLIPCHLHAAISHMIDEWDDDELI